jgi:hypothetical protein
MLSRDAGEAAPPPPPVFQCRSYVERSTFEPLLCVSDYLVLCGNCGEFMADAFWDQLAEVCTLGWKHVFLVPGPMEYRSVATTEDHPDGQDDPEPMTIDKIKGIMRVYEEALSPVLVILDDQIYDIDATTRIVGSTLWPHLDADLFANRSEMNRFYPEFNSIREHGSDTLSVETWNGLADRSHEYVCDIIKRTPHEKRLIVATHFLPTSLLLPDALLDDERRVQIRATERMAPWSRGPRSLSIPVWFCACYIDQNHDIQPFVRQLPAIYGPTLFYANHRKVDERVNIDQHTQRASLCTVAAEHVLHPKVKKGEQ